MGVSGSDGLDARLVILWRQPLARKERAIVGAFDSSSAQHDTFRSVQNRPGSVVSVA
jgi:hypothetical protein